MLEKAPRMLRNEVNLVPLPYRGVSVQPYDGAMTESAIVTHFLGREAYRRTEFVVLRASNGAYAVVAVSSEDRQPLFSPIRQIEVLALPDACCLRARSGNGLRQSLGACGTRAAKWDRRRRTLICEGKFDHVNFIHHPQPLVVKVVEVAPPEPPKLFDLVTHVLGYADLPPIIPVLERIELKELARNRIAGGVISFLAAQAGSMIWARPFTISMSARRRARTGRSSAVSEACSSIGIITATSRRASKCVRA